jgi:uncharacterized protein
MLILDAGGKRAGRIMGQRHLDSEDPALSRLFLEQIGHLVEPDDRVWDETVTRVLTGAGYTVRT